MLKIYFLARTCRVSLVHLAQFQTWSNYDIAMHGEVLNCEISQDIVCDAQSCYLCLFLLKNYVYFLSFSIASKPPPIHTTQPFISTFPVLGWKPVWVSLYDEIATQHITGVVCVCVCSRLTWNCVCGSINSTPYKPPYDQTSRCVKITRHASWRGAFAAKSIHVLRNKKVR